MSTRSFLRILVVVIAGVLGVGCSGAQTSSNAAPAILQTTLRGQASSLDAPLLAKCQHSAGFGIKPCHFTFTHPGSKQLDLIGAQGSGDTKEIDNCKRLATIGDVSGPIYFVTPKRAKGTCAAVFLHNGKFAILTIDDEL
ncbi:MAG: hypothetical protein JOY69_09215 [Candidatus Eremiobacteraeota bacterium]|nr:hypothetical protein [Candidatus Eremiobacteraeota bacterium]